jgi:predicted metalloprotease with PDZ domain
MEEDMVQQYQKQRKHRRVELLLQEIGLGASAEAAAAAAAHQETKEDAVGPDKLGLREHSVKFNVNRLLGFKVTQDKKSFGRLLVADVDPAGQADAAGVLVGQWLVSIDGEAISTIAQFKDVVKNNKIREERSFSKPHIRNGWCLIVWKRTVFWAKRLCF